MDGWGPMSRAGNATHQIKEMTNKQLLVTARPGSSLEEDIPEEALQGDRGTPLFPARRRHPRGTST